MTILDDLRFTARQLRRAPAFVITAVLTLTMAIAANVVVYGIANGLIFHPLPVVHPRELVQVQNPGFSGISFSYPNYRDLRERTTGTFSSLALCRLTRFAIGIDGVAQPAWGFMVNGDYFSTLGVGPQLGRVLAPADDVSVNGSAVMVLSDRTWRLRFHADPGVLGKVVPIGKTPFTVVGVAPRDFEGTDRFYTPDVWLPFHDGPEVDGSNGFESRGSVSFALVVGRLRPGITRAQADADLRRVSGQMAAEYPTDDAGTAWHTADVGLLGESFGKPVRAFLAGIAMLALLVLIAACANLGVLFSSRTADRARELGIRLAIGSSRGRILRQLGLEAMLVALVGGALASMCSRLLLQGVSAFRAPSGLPVQLLVDADWTVYLAAAGLALATGLLFAILPARQIWRTDPNHTMRASGSTPLGDRSLLRSVLLLVQITLCCLLLTASLVAFRGLQRAFKAPLGFDPQGVTLAIADVKLGGYDRQGQAAVQARLLAAVQAIPGVTMAAYSDNQPLSLNSNQDGVFAPGTTVFDHAHVRASAMVYRVSPNYFAVTATKLIAGRAFTIHDTPASPGVAIVNETLARRLFGTTDAVGKSFPGMDGIATEVVGVAADGKYLSLSEEPTPALFRSMLQWPDSTAVLIARSDRPAAEMTVAMRKAINGVDSGIPIFSVSSWPDALSIVTLPARIATLALGVMGGLAAVLSLTGIFGVTSYTVSQRLRELGIRVALGARTMGVLRAALGRTVVVLAAGSTLGLLLALASARLLAGVVYGASASDPLVLAAMALTMIALGAAASALPAQRALRAEPSQLLREQ